MINGNTPIWQLSVDELVELISEYSGKEMVNKSDQQVTKYVYGIPGIAKLFKCSMSTANRIKQSGAIDQAIKQIGKIIIVDAELALQLINNQSRRKKK
ncbi:MAG: DUF3853 family protein [Salinivirgaceae bacterium]|nr:DUF3853 family protein [Salinivirgaceae bacterium]MBP5668219.1 DUF3853 family protein [Salinivirgaceae bacterium]